MQRTKNNKYIPRVAVIIAAELFVAITLIKMLWDKDYENLLTALITFLLILLPEIIERIFHCDIHNMIYLYGVCYALGPMIGDCYKMYYRVNWWDKLLHISGGVMFALFGLFIFSMYVNHAETKRVLGALFALCFTMAISLAWEFYEFGVDQIFHTDMQHDTVIHDIYSYELSDEMGVIGSLENIEKVEINGENLALGGYLDIGLIDTMKDMLFESLGGLITVILYLLGKGKSCGFKRKEYKAIT